MNQGFAEKKDDTSITPGMTPTYASADTLGPQPAPQQQIQAPKIRDTATEQSNSVQRAKEAGEADPYAAAQNSSKYSIGTGITSKQPGITAYLQDVPERNAAMRQAVLNRKGIQQSAYSQGERQLDSALLSRTPTTQKQTFAEGGQTWEQDVPTQYMPDASTLAQYQTKVPAVDLGSEFGGNSRFDAQSSPSEVENAIVNLQRRVLTATTPEQKNMYNQKLSQLQNVYSAALSNQDGGSELRKNAFDFNGALQKGDASTIGSILDSTYNVGSRGVETPDEVRSKAALQAANNMSGLNTKAQAQVDANKASADAEAKATGDKNVQIAQRKKNVADAQAHIRQMNGGFGDLDFTIPAVAAAARNSGVAQGVAEYLVNTYHMTPQEANAYVSGKRSLQDVLTNTAGTYMEPYSASDAGWLGDIVEGGVNLVGGIL